MADSTAGVPGCVIPAPPSERTTGRCAARAFRVPTPETRVAQDSVGGEAASAVGSPGPSQGELVAGDGRGGDREWSRRDGVDEEPPRAGGGGVSGADSREVELAVRLGGLGGVHGDLPRIAAELWRNGCAPAGSRLRGGRTGRRRHPRTTRCWDCPGAPTQLPVSPGPGSGAKPSSYSQSHSRNTQRLAQQPDRSTPGAGET